MVVPVLHDSGGLDAQLGVEQLELLLLEEEEEAGEVGEAEEVEEVEQLVDEEVELLVLEVEALLEVREV